MQVSACRVILTVTNLHLQTHHHPTVLTYNLIIPSPNSPYLYPRHPITQQFPPTTPSPHSPQLQHATTPSPIFMSQISLFTQWLVDSVTAAVHHHRPNRPPPYPLHSHPYHPCTQGRVSPQPSLPQGADAFCVLLDTLHRVDNGT